MKVFCTYCGAANPGDRAVCGACTTPLEAARPLATPAAQAGQPGSPAVGPQGLSAQAPRPATYDPYASVRQPGPLYPPPASYEEPAPPYPYAYAPASDLYSQVPDPDALYPAQYPSPQPYGQTYPSPQPPGPYTSAQQPSYPQDPYAAQPYADQGYSFPAPAYPQVPGGYAAQPTAQPYPASTYSAPTYLSAAYAQLSYPQPYPQAPSYPQPYPPAGGYQGPVPGWQGNALAPYGGPGSLASTLPRFGSYLFDLIMFSIILLVLGTIVGGLNLGAIGGLLLLAAHPLYCIGFWATTGQTPGYKAAGLQLVKSDGTKVGLGAAIIRYIGLSVTVPLFLLGCLWMIWDYKKQALYDKMADTLVIRA